MFVLEHNQHLTHDRAQIQHQIDCLCHHLPIAISNVMLQASNIGAAPSQHRSAHRNRAIATMFSWCRRYCPAGTAPLLCIVCNNHNHEMLAHAIIENHTPLSGIAGTQICNAMKITTLLASNQCASDAFFCYWRRTAT